MEFDKVVTTRRSIREYNDSPLDKETILNILEAGRLAPSAKNRQPWHFVVVFENKSLKEEISNKLKENTDESTSKTCDVIKNSECLILIFADIVDELMDIQSVGASIENMTLKATDLNVASLWIGFIVQIESILQEMFKTDKRLVAALALGYSDKKPKERPRKTIEEIVEWF